MFVLNKLRATNRIQTRTRQNDHCALREWESALETNHGGKLLSGVAGTGEKHSVDVHTAYLASLHALAQAAISMYINAATQRELEIKPRTHNTTPTLPATRQKAPIRTFQQ